MPTNQALITKAYTAFNNRDIETALSLMHTDVEWPNTTGESYLYGHEAVRDYWTQQWVMFDPQVAPIAFKANKEGLVVVDVHQLVRDLSGKVLADYMVQHVYTMEGGLVRKMEIRKV